MTDIATDEIEVLRTQRVPKVSPIFDVYKPIEEDRSIEEYRYVEIPCDNGNKISHHDTRFIFKTPVNESFMFPSDSKLRVRGRIMKLGNDGNTLEHLTYADGIATIQNNGWSLFSNVILRESSKEIENKLALPGVGATIMKLLREEPDEVETTGPLEFFWIDEKTGKKYKDDGTFEDVPIEETISGLLPNSEHTTFGQLERIKETRRSREFVFELPLRKLFNFLYDNPIVMRGIQLELELRRETSQLSTVLHIPKNGGVDRDLASKLRIDLLELTWLMRYVTPEPELKGTLIKSLQSNNLVKLAYGDWGVHLSPTFDYSEVRPAWTLTSNYKPEYLFVVPMLKCRLDGRKYNTGTEEDPVYTYFNGMYENNTMFDHLRIRQASCYLNGRKVPVEKPFQLQIKEELEIDQDSDGNDVYVPKRQYYDYSSVYEEWLNASYAHKGKIASPVTKALFRESYPIFCFDFTKLESSVYGSFTTHEIRPEFHIDETPLNELDTNLDSGKYLFVNIIVAKKFYAIEMNDNRMSTTISAS